MFLFKKKLRFMFLNTIAWKFIKPPHSTQKTWYKYFYNNAYKFYTWNSFLEVIYMYKMFQTWTCFWTTFFNFYFFFFSENFKCWYVPESLCEAFFYMQQNEVSDNEPLRQGRYPHNIVTNTGRTLLILYVLGDSYVRGAEYGTIYSDSSVLIL